MQLSVIAGLTGPEVGVLVAVVAASMIVGFIVRVLLEHLKRDSLDKELQADKNAARAEGGKIVAQAEAQAKSELISHREQFGAETESTRKELRAEEKRLGKRADLIDQKLETLQSKERMIEAAEKGIHERERALANKDRQLNELIGQQKSQLLKVANLTIEEARKAILERVEKDMEEETAELIQKRIDRANEEAESKAREIVISSIQRYAADHTCESTVSTVDIPSDDMKGRVIGREGRNIRAFEKATGVDVIVDDTPGVVVVSSFDPVRREVARRTLERLIQDGRIHPTRIEETVGAMEKEVQKQVYDQGKQATLEAKVRGLHNKLMELLGRLHFRTSYGQNVLKHSMEVAYLSQIIADELGLNGQIARRCGLLHDIGKAVDHEVQGGHPEIGADLCKRYGEKEEVANAAGAHHGDLEATSVYTPIVAAADAISASRPGARRESLERYVQRLQKLEEIATAFEGVQQAYAIQAGREVRVIVDPSGVDDRLSGKIARDIARRVEEEMEYPGEVKVTLVRELRCVEYAK
ncbi:MAG: ribonuclease Y [Phycisphaerae bacterium]|nr:ribonuclease Y [Phycisphaerae bacterium]MDP7635975.1 ribonuclease Y [Phycisphaerae bacterium]